jgi:hypothetical protein
MYDEPDVFTLDCSLSKYKIKDISIALDSCDSCGKKVSTSMMKESIDTYGMYCKSCLVEGNFLNTFSDTKYDWVLDEDRDHVIRDRSSNAVVCALVDFPLCRGEIGFIIKNAPVSFYKSLIAKNCLTEILEENDIEKIKSLASSVLEKINAEG